MKFCTRFFHLILFFCVLFSFNSCNNEKKKNLNTSPLNHIEYYHEDQKIPLMEIVKKELALGKTAILHFSATWCGPCKKFEASLPDPLMQSALKGVVLISIDIDSDAMADGWAAKYGINAVPTFAKIDAEGNVTEKISSNDWDDDVPEKMAPVFSEFVGN